MEGRGKSKASFFRREWVSLRSTGFLIAAFAGFHIAPMIFAVIDGRYDTGMSERAFDTTSLTNYKFKDVIVQAGLSLVYE